MGEDSQAPSVRCDDGTVIPFGWVYPDAPAYEWLRDRAHWPEPMTPMEVSLRALSLPGVDRAWNEIGMEPLALFRRFQIVGPFLYVRMTPYPPERMAEIVPRYMEVRRQFGGALQFWQQYGERRIRQACSDIAVMRPGTSLVALAEAWGYGFHQTFTSASLLTVANIQLTALLAEYAGSDATLLSFEVTQGGENASQAIDGEIWRLSELAHSSPVVTEILVAEHDDAIKVLRGEPGATEFLGAFDALIDRHGGRSQGWNLRAETWDERPEAALALVRAQLDAACTTPAERAARTAARRLEATERALAVLPQERHKQFCALVDQLEGYVTIREGRAYWQMMVTGAVRHMLMRLGTELVAQARMDEPQDILFVGQGDLTEESGDFRAKVSAGRNAWERSRQLAPPAFIGTPGDMAAAAAAMRGALRGMPASRGTVTARARVLRSLEEGARLKPGEILVCAMTTPAWTPLFALAGGVITESGAPLSHPAITAREYGIPAIVALENATTRIKDGQLITVDGAAGTVSLAESAEAGVPS
jgi:pyruvate,water dikinase